MALLGIFREKKTRSHKILSTNVCSSSRCNSQELETTQMNLSRQIIKETVVPLYDGILWAAFLLKPKAFSALNQQRALAIDKREKSFLETVSGIHLECWGNTKTVILLTKSIARPAEVTCSLFIQQICDQYCKPSSVLDTRSWRCHQGNYKLIVGGGKSYRKWVKLFFKVSHKWQMSYFLF